VNHANITIRVVKVSSGNGLVNIPRIDGGTNNFGTVTIQGDLGEIDCGSDAAGAVALVKLSVNSIGADTALYQTLSGTISGDGVSRIQGALVSLTVTHDVDTSYIRVGDGANLGSVTIGGSLIGSSTGDTGEIYAEGNLGTAVIKKNIVGGTNTMTYANNYSGAIGAGHEIHSVTVGGSVIGGTGQYSGYIYSGYLATGNLDKVSIGGNIDGTEVNLYSGEVFANGKIGSAFVGGNLNGGHDAESGSIAAVGDIASVTVKGSLFGGDGGGGNTGTISGAHLGSATIGHDLVGGASSGDGSIVFASIGKVKIGGSLKGNEAPGDGGSVVSSGDIASVIVAGSLMGSGTGYDGSIHAGGHLDSVIIDGNVGSTDGSYNGVIQGDTGIDSVHILGNLTGGLYNYTGEVSGNGHGIKKAIVDGEILAGTGTDSGVIHG
jgi:hypothetical protein